MRPGHPSRTMVNTAVQRAAHQLIDDVPLIFTDPIAVGLVPEATEEVIRASAAEYQSAGMKPGRASMALRSRFAEDCLEAAVRRGVRQYVIVAAGLDTFAWRQPAWARDLEIFFVDMPESLDWSREQFRRKGLVEAANIRFVPVDLENDNLEARLADHGLRGQQPIFSSALGIIQFLTPKAIEALFAFAAAAPKRSEMVLSCHPPADDIEGSAQSGLLNSIARGAALGEPWLSLVRPEDIVTRLWRSGFTTVFHLTPELAQARYFAGRNDGLRAARSLQMIAAMT